MTAAEKLTKVFFKEDGSLTNEAIALIPADGIEKGKEVAYIVNTLIAFNLPEEFIVEHIDVIDLRALIIEDKLTDAAVLANPDRFGAMVNNIAIKGFETTDTDDYILDQIFETEILDVKTKVVLLLSALESSNTYMQEIATGKVALEDGFDPAEAIEMIAGGYSTLFLKYGAFISAALGQDLIEIPTALGALSDWTWIIMNVIASNEIPDEVVYRMTKSSAAYAITQLDDYDAIQRAVNITNDIFNRQEEAAKNAQ